MINQVDRLGFNLLTENRDDMDVITIQTEEAFYAERADLVVQ